MIGARSEGVRVVVVARPPVVLDQSVDPGQTETRMMVRTETLHTRTHADKPESEKE